MEFTGQYMLMIKGQLDMNTIDMATISDDGSSASWTGNVPAPGTVLVTKRVGIHDEVWFIIDVNQQTYEHREDEFIK